MHFCRIKALNLILIHLVKQFLHLKTEPCFFGFFFRLDKCNDSSGGGGCSTDNAYETVQQDFALSDAGDHPPIFMLIEKHKLFTQT